MTGGALPVGEVQALVIAFEARAIPPAEFSHPQHVLVAWGLAQRYGREEGLRRMIEGIQAMTVSAGRPDAYHVTITKAWFELIASVDDLELSGELLDKTIIHRYYTPARLDDGRHRWVEPDLGPLRLPDRPRAGGQRLV